MTRIILALIAACAMLTPALATGPHQAAIECHDGPRRIVRIVVETCETLAECRDYAAEPFAQHQAKIRCAPHDWELNAR